MIIGVELEIKFTNHIHMFTQVNLKRLFMIVFHLNSAETMDINLK